MKLEGWRIEDKTDGSLIVLLVSKHYFKENVLSRFLEDMESELPDPDGDDLDIGNITITIPQSVHADGRMTGEEEKDDPSGN